ncbi:MAG TPA: hypothetical protein VGB30_03105, partial [bacterium]
MLSTHPVIRISLILIYFTLCQACGAPDNAPEQAAQSNVATDVNYIGGGTQAPYETQEPEYNSPMIPDDHVPTALAWAGSIRQAISLAGSDRKYRIIVWFENQNCAECNQVRTDVFNDPDVIAETRYWLFVKV